MQIKFIAITIAFLMCCTTFCNAQSYAGKVTLTGGKKETTSNTQSDNSAGKVTSDETTNNSQPNSSSDDVTLTVSADGITKEEATKIALRNAIEQTYGAFVSANTTILNDEIIKDEVVTISNGNIKSYNEITSIQLPNGRIAVTLNATVSISQLISYAQSKGATTEFAGAAFTKNIKMMELNKKNEKIVLENLIKQLRQLAPYTYDMTLNVEEIYRRHREMVRIYIDNNKNRRYELVDVSNTFVMPLQINYIKNNNTAVFYKLIEDTFKSLKMSKNEYDYFGGSGRGRFSYFRFDLNDRTIVSIELRNEIKELGTFYHDFEDILYKVFFDIEIEDNLGHISGFKDYTSHDNSDHDSSYREKFHEGGYHLFKSCQTFQNHIISNTYGGFRINDREYFEIQVYLPLEEIEKYNSFTVRHKN